jgi:hypothetical protein
MRSTTLATPSPVAKSATMISISALCAVSMIAPECHQPITTARGQYKIVACACQVFGMGLSDTRRCARD